MNTAPFSLAVHAAEESRPANTENEISADVIGCQNTDEPEAASAAEESAPASSEDEPEPAETYEIETVYDLNPAESEQASVTEEPGAVESETSGDGEDTDLTGSEQGGATGETESAGPETGMTAEEPDSAESHYLGENAEGSYFRHRLRFVKARRASRCAALTNTILLLPRIIIIRMAVSGMLLRECRKMWNLWAWSVTWSEKWAICVRHTIHR